VLFNKPWGVLSQFSDREGRRTLADFIDLPDVYPAGRLDRDSEGLLVLTDDGHMQNRISDPVHGLTKDYLVQVEGRPTQGQLEQLRKGVQLADGAARALDVHLLAHKPGWLWSRDPPIRSRKHIPVSWLQITLDEGRNRQVRRMTAAVGLPALRLVRTRVGDWELAGLESGKWRLQNPG